MKRKLGDVAMDVMVEENSEWIGYNEYGMLDEVYDRAKQEGVIKPIGSRGGKSREHPLNNHLVVLNALDRDKRFVKSYIRIGNDAGRQVLCREFQVKK